MSPRHGEVWLVDMGMVAKTRPGWSQARRLTPHCAMDGEKH